MYSEAFSAFCDPRVTESSLEDLSLRGAFDSIHESVAQPLQGIYFEEHVTLSSSARPDVQLSVPIQVKDKVKCTWHGCSALVKKDNLSRHVKEVHEGKIKAVCAGCGKEFKRPYQMDEHIVRTRCGRS
ncbi:hypothetical protein C8R48DRAFT_360840 [Suillus tomentosus]|nr:hypothetical protein C8R48DRAFT_360840 [Suillus tomentosus]